MKKCNKCNLTKPKEDFYSRGGANSHRLSAFCKQCMKKYTIERSKGLKQKILNAINKHSCEICGYDKCNGALEFHHLDPNKKDFQLSKASSRSMDSILKEVAKCILVCSNCHKEIHNDMHKDMGL